MERNIFTDNRLDWQEIVAAAKLRRRQMNLTQRRLAAIAGVSLPTVVGFEAGQDIRLSSALAILKVLDMAALRIEGTLRIRASGDGGTEPFQAMFSPYTGPGGAMEPHILATREALDVFLELLRIGAEEKQEAFNALVRENAADIVNVQLSPVELHRNWPAQFSLSHA